MMLPIRGVRLMRDGRLTRRHLAGPVGTRRKQPRRSTGPIDEACFAGAYQHQRAHIGDGRIGVAKGGQDDALVRATDGAGEGDRGRR
jgi:hypothetical protein